MNVFRTRTLAIILAGLAPAMGHAGSPKPAYVEPTVTAPQPTHDWEFKYVGLSLGYASGETLAPIGFPGGPLDLLSDDHDIEGYGLGIIAGRNWTRGDFLYGVDAGLTFSGIQGDDADQTTVVNGTDVTAHGHVSGRVGWTFDRAMLYGSAGLAMMMWDQTERQDVGSPRSNTNSLFGAGGRLAIGLEALLGDGVLRLEAAHTHIGEQVGFHPLSGQSGAYDMGSEPSFSEISISYAIRF